MPFERIGTTPRRIAVIGGGISGLAAAHLLARDHAVVLYEAERRLGGHARTVMVGERAVDTGFIVFNRVNYPRLSRLFADLGVPVTPSDMSFGASIGRLEYGLRDLRAVFAQPGNALDPRFLRMLRDILRFNARGLALAGRGMTVADLLARLGTGGWFRDRYLLPLSGAIWSTPAMGMLEFPAAALMEFFRNHALLSHRGQHPWLTVRGGSVEYVRRLQGWLLAHGVDLRPGTPVAGVRREGGAVLVRARGGEWESFDEVVLATHADVSLRLLDARPEERAALGAIRFQPNQAVLHSDPAVMPRRRAVWSSWNYVQPAGPRARRIDLTYWMNSLQPIPGGDLFVTLNGNVPLDPRRVHDSVTFRHPVYDLAAQAARAAIRRFNGARGTWFCGAWLGNGFHEDGFASAAEVASTLAARDRLAA